MPRVLLLGATGQIGLEALRAHLPDGLRWLAPTRSEFDLADVEAIEGALERFSPDAIINAAAYTAVDAAERDTERAFALNRDAPAELARVAARLSIPLVHISTDYVFDGRKPEPYVETDPIAPLSAYGRSKAEGERAVLETYPGATIVRTSWVFSPHRSNFVKTMLRLGADRREVSVVADQHGRPTHASDIALACIELSQRLIAGDARAQGVFHFAGSGDTTWAAFAAAIFAEAEKHGRAPVHVRAISTAEYPTEATRPANSRLDTSKIESIGIRPRAWHEALPACISEVLAAR